MSGDLDKLKKKRSPLRRNATRLVSKGQEICGSDLNESKRVQAEAIREELKEQLNLLKELDSEIYECIYEKEEDEAVDKEVQEATDYKGRIRAAILLIDDALKKFSSKSIEDPERSFSAGSIGSSAGRTARVKLPKLEIRKFSGKIHEWNEFWDGFSSSIHSNDELSDVDKLKYLRGYLEGSARSVIAGIPTTGASYEIAVELLRKRFDRPNVIQRAHINELINLPPVFSEKNAVRMRQFLDEIEIHRRGLESMYVDMETYSKFIVPILMDKVPESVRLNMIRFNERNHLEWMITDFTEAFEKEIRVRECHVPIRSQNVSAVSVTPRRQRQPPQHYEEGSASALTVALKKGKKCVFCMDESHAPENCDKIRSQEDRKKILMRFAKCFNCLNSGHRVVNCRCKSCCTKCKRKHHTSICNKQTRPVQQVSEQTASQASIAAAADRAIPLDPTAASWVGNVQSDSKVALQTALAVVDDKKERTVRVLFDSGSQKSFVTAKTVQGLRLKAVRKEKVGIRVFGMNDAEYEVREVVRFRVSSVNGGESVEVECYVVPEISSIANAHIEVAKNDYPYLRQLYFSDVAKNQEELECHILIGSNYIWEFQKGETIRGGPNEPVAVRTTLGWVISGPLRGGQIDGNEVQVHFVQSTTKQEKDYLDEKVSKLWDLDSLGIRQDNEVHEKLIDNISFTGQRYSVALPWKSGHDELPSNYGITLNRLQVLLKKLKKDPDILSKYDEVIREQEKAGIIQKVTNLEPADKVHYLPHRAVVREDAETTKVRVVFDASCKKKNSGTSLNNCLHVGPPLTPLILEILLRVRAHNVSLVADIEKAFLNIEIDEVDRDCLRFLWVDDIHSENPEIQIFRYNRVVFGVNSSPFILNAVLRHHLESFNDTDPELTSKVKENFFVDDVVTGADSAESAYQLYQKAKDVLRQGGFTLRKWKSNNQDLMQRINDAEKSNILENGQKENPEIQDSFAKETLGTTADKHESKTKVLGIGWDMQSDTLEINLSKVSNLDLNPGLPTKRIILSTLASIFDPLGLVSPVLVSPKVLFQEMCIESLNWDDPLPQEKLSLWEEWVKDIEDVGRIEIPRCYTSAVKGEVLSYSLHGFGDASSKAYSAVIYLVCQTSQGIYTKLVASKTRVAPLKKLSINRLELLSAKILVTLMASVKKTLANQISIKETRYWLDSQTALYWVNNNGEWKQFVKNRVNEILSMSSKTKWGHVSGTENPADIGSRGVNASQLKSSKLWWEGPSWLKGCKQDWPRFNETDRSERVSVDVERKKETVLSIQTKIQTGISNVIDIGRFNSLNRLLRVTALVVRFVRNIRAKRVARYLDEEPLSAEEIDAAEKLWILDVQDSLRTRPEFSKVKESLGVVLQGDFLVCKGRLENAELEERAKYPIILPRDNKFTELVIWMCHDNVEHLKVGATLTELRSRFWVTKGRQLVKKIIHKCFICKRCEGKSFRPPVVAPLPDYRVSEAPPFSRIGVDFAGPLYSKGSDGKMNKCYVALFTCCVTRAVHIELVTDLTASNFLNALRKFAARRGKPSLIVSDNAKTFETVAKFLKKVYSDERLQDYLVNKRIQWIFNLERASWWGGHFERIVGLVKRCLRKVIGKAKLSFLELEVVLCEVESNLNSRPLTYCYEDLGEEPLTPSHLLHGRRFSNLFSGAEAKPDFENYNKLSTRFKYLHTKLNHFWKRWKTEYLTGLREVHKLQNRKQVVINPGDVVLIGDENVKRGFWKIGIVEELVVGKDGIVRGAKVKKAGKGKPDFVSRPLQKLYPLELSCSSGTETNNMNVKENVKEKDEVRKERKERGEEAGNPGRVTPRRAAAADARVRTQLMLDYG